MREVTDSMGFLSFLTYDDFACEGKVKLPYNSA